ncbi:MAG: RNA polymerase sigma factor [Acidobacteria bacterium]|nr:RNA polymerase sigma factor [Acidobacteriota bacterium]
MSGGSPVPAADELSRVAAQIKRLLLTGETQGAREAFANIVRLEQRRASRLAYYVLRNAADADEAVQDAFVKVYGHLGSYREEIPFEIWFTRILINGCLDRRKARQRRERWTSDGLGYDREMDGRRASHAAVASGPTPEQRVLSQERHRQIGAAVQKLPERQRLVFLLSQYDGRTPQEISVLTGLNESTIRVHLFRALRKLRSSLEGLL